MTTSFQVSDLGKINEADLTTWFLDACDLTGWHLRYHTYRSKRSPSGFQDWVIWRTRANESASMMLIELKGWDTRVDPRQVELVNASRACGVPSMIARPRHAGPLFAWLVDPPTIGVPLPPLLPADFAR